MDAGYSWDEDTLSYLSKQTFICFAWAWFAIFPSLPSRVCIFNVRSDWISLKILCLILFWWEFSFHSDNPVLILPLVCVIASFLMFPCSCIIFFFFFFSTSYSMNFLPNWNFSGDSGWCFRSSQCIADLRFPSLCASDKATCSLHWDKAIIVHTDT